MRVCARLAEDCDDQHLAERLRIMASHLLAEAEDIEQLPGERSRDDDRIGFALLWLTVPKRPMPIACQPARLYAHCSVAAKQYAAALLFLPPDKALFNLSVDFMQPSFCAIAFLFVKVNLSLRICDPMFRRVKLMRKLLRHVEHMLAIGFGHASGLVQQLQNGLPGGIELVTVV